MTGWLTSLHRDLPGSRLLVGIACTGLLVGGLTVGIVPNAHAASATFTVTTTADSGAGSLRQAIIDANLTPDDDTIVFSLPDPSTIVLTSDLPQITTPMTITGPGQNSLTIDAATYKAFFINQANTSISDLSMTGATHADSNNGALIHNTKATSTVTRVTIFDSEAPRVVYNKEAGSYLTIDSSLFTGNAHPGGSTSQRLVYNDHGSGNGSDNVLTVTNSTFSNNDSYALWSYRRLIASDDTFIGNFHAVNALGGGDHQFTNNVVSMNDNGARINPSSTYSNSATITGNTFSSNTGYGLSTTVTAPATATITGNTFSGNSPDLLYNGSSTVPSGIAATNTFVAGPIPALSSASMPFGAISVGATSADSSITFSNTGGSSLTINGGGIAITGGDDTDYTVTGGTCSAGATVTAGSSCTIDLAFAPTQSGARSATLTVATSAGSVTAALSGTGLSAPPRPIPAVPAPAPIDVGATEGDRSLSVSWAAPASSGSFPITHYQVTTRPSGGSCLVSAGTTGCTLEGLSNGTEYEVRVRALTGAGWGAWSEPVSVTPQSEPSQASIMISGSRSQKVIQVVGEVIDGEIDAATVWARMPGQAHYSAQQEVRTTRDGQRFTWQIATRNRVYVFVRATLPGGEELRSNRVIIPRLSR